MKIKKLLAISLAVFFVVATAGCSYSKNNQIVDDVASVVPLSISEEMISPPIITDMASQTAAVPAKKTGFFQVSGRKILDPDLNPIRLDAMGLFLVTPERAKTVIIESGYKEIKELGFNAMRFYLGYELMADPDDPSIYREDGFLMLDQHLAWAKKYGISVILNMHYAPSVKSNGGSSRGFWDNKNHEQEDLVALWKKIAQRYKDNTTVIGYGLLNEPRVNWMGTKEKSLEQWRSLAQKITNTIREVDRNHILVVEKAIMAMNDSQNETASLNDDMNFIPIKDSEKNVMYEAHLYPPVPFVNIRREHVATSNKVNVYPNENLLVTFDYKTTNGTVDHTYLKDIGKTTDNGNGWELQETNWIQPDAQKVSELRITPHVKDLGAGAAYFDNFVISTYNQSTKKIEQVLEINFNNEKEVWNSIYTVGTAPKSTYDDTGGIDQSGCIKVSGGQNNSIVGKDNPIRIWIKPGYSYKLSGLVKKVNTSATAEAYPAFAFGYNPKGSSPFTKQSIETAFKRYNEIGAKYNVPIFIGEYGVNFGALESLGGDQWLRDFIDTSQKYGFHSNFHHYHGGMYALYSSAMADVVNPSVYNPLMGSIFKEKLAGTKKIA